ncbi:MAG: glycosyl transferase [Myxococcaceae bacterium]|nr:glycosyl transferase [Myxococcaceae bacterium]
MSLENWLLLLTSLAAVTWPAVAVGALASYRRCRSVVPEQHFDLDARRQPRLSVVIPARNEQADIEATVRSVLAQKGVQLEVIVINDHSTDRTGEILNAIAAEDSRLRVLHDPPLKEGWLGKANAMRFGSSFATGDYIVFTDADILHKQGCFAAASQEMEEHQLSLLSLLPMFIWESIWENAAAPAFLLAMTNFLSGPIHDADSDDALAVGAFIMVDAEIYRSLGGHEGVRSEMLDDVMLARHFKSHGQRVAFRVAPQCLSVRLYNSPRAVFYGVIKNCLAVFGENFWLAIPLALTFAVGGLSVLAAPFVGLFLLNPTLLALGLFVYFEVWLAVVLARSYMHTNLFKLAGFVVGVPLLIGAALMATYQAVFYGSVLWRGRAIRVTE